MRKFWKTIGVERQELEAYLAGHARYWTVGPSKKQTSYANLLLVERMHSFAKMEEIIPEELSSIWRGVMWEWQEKYNHKWQPGFNGNNLVLYKGIPGAQARYHCVACRYDANKPTEYCPKCGAPTQKFWDVICFSSGVDMSRDYSGFSDQELLERAKLVQNFDRLCEDLITLAMVANSRKVLIS